MRAGAAPSGSRPGMARARAAGGRARARTPLAQSSRTTERKCSSSAWRASATCGAAGAPGGGGRVRVHCRGCRSRRGQLHAECSGTTRAISVVVTHASHGTRCRSARQQHRCVQPVLTLGLAGSSLSHDGHGETSRATQPGPRAPRDWASQCAARCAWRACARPARRRPPRGTRWPRCPGWSAPPAPRPALSLRDHVLQ